MDAAAQSLLEEVQTLSGSLREPTKRICYSTYHFDAFQVLDAERNTADRFRLFGIRDFVRYDGQVVLDLGSHLGAMSLEFARRGARVLGLEYNTERVQVANKLADYLRVDAAFQACDLNHYDFTRAAADIVVCCALDAHLQEREAFYARLLGMRPKLCYFESNADADVAEFKARAALHGLLTNYLGTSACASDTTQGNPRKLFVLSREPFELGGAGVQPRGEVYVKTYYSQDEWVRLRGIYEQIADMPAVPRMTFPEPKVVHLAAVPGVSLALARGMALHKQQMISFLTELNRRGFCHRDLNARNVLIGADQLYVLDWDFVTDQRCPLAQSYDLTGQGAPSPRLTSHMHIFRGFPPAALPSVAEQLDLCPEDFL